MTEIEADYLRNEKRQLELRNIEIAKAYEELQKENAELEAQIEGKENEFQYFSNSFKIKISNLKAQIEKQKIIFGQELFFFRLIKIVR